MGELSSLQFIRSGYVPTLLDGHLHTARRRLRKVVQSEISDGEETHILAQYVEPHKTSADNKYPITGNGHRCQDRFLEVFL
jgi:hypothetical protein